MNKRGNIMINILFFVMSLLVVAALIPVIKVGIDWTQQSNAMNCYGYVYNGNPNSPLSYNGSLQADNQTSGNSFGCAVTKLYIPYILLVFLIFGVSKILYGRAEDVTGGVSQ